MRLTAVAVVLVGITSRLAGAQTAAGATVRGVVYDSIHGAPLAGAIVQLAAADHLSRFGATTPSDASGRFALRDVPAGRYMLGFFHPMLDSLGIAAPVHEVVVEGDASVRRDLAIPSPATLRRAICASVADSGALLLGVVRDARQHAPADSATVVGEWLEIRVGHDGLVTRVPRRVAHTGENGWFAMCNVPTAGTMTLLAVRGADSTDVVEVTVPADGFLRQDLFLGAGHAVRVNGTVSTAVRGARLPGAIVRIGGAATRTNERGEWTLDGAAAGTRTLEVRAVGFYPEHRVLHLGVEESGAIGVSLSTMKAVLDTVTIRATRIYDRDRIEFMQRRRSTGGRFLTPEDIARRGGTFATDIFRSVPGMRIGFAADTLESDFNMIPQDSIAATNRMILMRGIAGNYCAPAVFLNGFAIPDLRADDIDSWVHPREITGIEIYSENATPAPYQRGPRGCGSILIWKKGP